MSAADAGAVDVRHVYEEVFVGLDLQVTIHRDIEGISLLARGDRLSSQTAHLIIVVSRARGTVLSSDIESNAAFGRRLVKAQDESENRGAGVAFIQADIVD